MRRFPKVLADEFEEAMSVTDRLGHEQAMELLARFRRNRAKMVATWGIANIGDQVNGFEPFPLEHLHTIERLDKAFQKLHRYRNGGAGDYAAADVEREINRFRASGPRKRVTIYDEIAEYLQKRGYAQSDNKKALVADAINQFSDDETKISESTVRRAIRSAGLSGKNLLSLSG